METSNTSSQNTQPLAVLLRAAGRHLADATEQALFAGGSNRREWRMLNLIDGTAPSGRRGRMPHPGRAQILIDRGWAAWGDEGLALTDQGRAAKDRLGDAIDAVRAQVTEGISDADYETTVHTLEQIARNLGWSEDAPLPRRHRGHGRGRGFGRGFGHGHGREHGFGFGHGHGYGRGRGFAHEPEFAHGPGFAHEHDCTHEHSHAHGHGFGRRGRGFSRASHDA